jgi:hypothetical protein
MNLLTTKDVAQLIEEKTGFPMGVRQVQKEIKAGHLVGEKVGNLYLVSQKELARYKRRKPGIVPKK